jgi:type VI secretion system protein
MDAGLFDVLSGRFADGRPIDSVAQDERTLMSVVTHLNHLLSTRRGSLPHMPDYGLPSISEIYRDMPDSVVELQRSIKTTVERFEPRLKRVHVTYKETDRLNMRLVFLLAGELENGQRAEFQTVFSSHELVNVAPSRDRHR